MNRKNILVSIYQFPGNEITQLYKLISNFTSLRCFTVAQRSLAVTLDTKVTFVSEPRLLRPLEIRFYQHSTYAPGHPCGSDLSKSELDVNNIRCTRQPSYRYPVHSFCNKNLKIAKT